MEALIKKHEDFEKPLAAQEEKIKALKKSWDELMSAAKERKKKLDESYYLHRFLADYRDLTRWINDMKAVISADELAKDVSGAEALLERHQKHKSEIDAREDSFGATAKAGKKLLESDHYASDKVKEKLATLSDDKNALLELWKERLATLEAVDTAVSEKRKKKKKSKKRK